MKDIFAEFYTKVIGFFRRTDEQVQENSKDVARNRLRVVLMQDRTNLTPELLERMRKELVELLSKYVEMDKEALELNLEQEGDQMALMLSIPVVRAKDEEEIEAALAKDDESDKESEKTDKAENTENLDDENADSESVAEASEKEDSVTSEDENKEADKTPEEGSDVKTAKEKDEPLKEQEVSEPQKKNSK